MGISIVLSTSHGGSEFHIGFPMLICLFVNALRDCYYRPISVCLETPLLRTGLVSSSSWYCWTKDGTDSAVTSQVCVRSDVVSGQLEAVTHVTIHVSHHLHVPDDPRTGRAGHIGLWGMPLRHTSSSFEIYLHGRGSSECSIKRGNHNTLVYACYISCHCVTVTITETSVH